jgi:cytochrome c oxidase subunit 1
MIMFDRRDVRADIPPEPIQTGLQFLTPDLYNTYMSLHGIVMIMGILLGVGAMSNYLVPLLIGASDMAFPRLNGFAFWINVPSGILLLSSLFLGGFDTGWVGYPPLSVRAPLGMQMFFLGVYLFGISSILGALNVLATIGRMRIKSMTPFRMPIFVWSALATAIRAPSPVLPAAANTTSAFWSRARLAVTAPHSGSLKDMPIAPG